MLWSKLAQEASLIKMTGLDALQNNFYFLFSVYLFIYFLGSWTQRPLVNSEATCGPLFWTMTHPLRTTVLETLKFSCSLWGNFQPTHQEWISLKTYIVFAQFSNKQTEMNWVNYAFRNPSLWSVFFFPTFMPLVPPVCPKLHHKTLISKDQIVVTVSRNNFNSSHCSSVLPDSHHAWLARCVWLRRRRGELHERHQATQEAHAHPHARTPNPPPPLTIQYTPYNRSCSPSFTSLLPFIVPL